MNLEELVAMADMYASTCTRQEEKYQDIKRHGYTWEWVDCIAAYDLIRELPNYWQLVQQWRKLNVCDLCSFPNTFHSVHCSKYQG